LIKSSFGIIITMLTILTFLKFLTKNTKIIVLTGYVSDENVNKAYKSGADKVLIKPIGNRELLKEIEAIV